MLVNCETKRDALEMLRAVWSWLADPDCVHVDEFRDLAEISVIEAMGSVRAVTAVSRHARVPPT